MSGELYPGGIMTGYLPDKHKFKLRDFLDRVHLTCNKCNAPSDGVIGTNLISSQMYFCQLYQ